MEKAMTFADLESIIDCWTREIDDCHGIFKNQAEDVTKHFFNVMQNNEKVTVVSHRLCILNHMNEQLDKDLHNASDLVKKFETIMVQLQNIVIMMQEKTPIDVPREEIFGLSEKINSCLNSCKDDVDLLVQGINLENADDSNNPAEKVASIMMILLKNLDYLETKMEQMKCHINWIHHECKRIIGTEAAN